MCLTNTIHTRCGMCSMLIWVYVWSSDVYLSECVLGACVNRSLCLDVFNRVVQLFGCVQATHKLRQSIRYISPQHFSSFLLLMLMLMLLLLLWYFFILLFFHKNLNSVSVFVSFNSIICSLAVFCCIQFQLECVFLF